MSWRRSLAEQFHHPRGPAGVVAGWIMATRASNLARNRWTVDLLELEPTDHVLELGPGPGVTLGLIAERVPRGHVVGVDHSAAMVRRARRVNARVVASGLLEVVQGDITDLPDLPGPFDRILAVNSLQFDGMHERVLVSVAGLLKPGGRLAITFQPRGAQPSEAAALAFAQRVADLLKGVGLTDLRIDKLPMAPVCAVCVQARKPDLWDTAGETATM